MVGRKGTWGFSPRCPQSVLSLLLNSLLLKQVTYIPWSQNGSLTPVFRPRAGLGRPAEEAELCPSSWWSRFIDLTLASDRVLPPPILIARALVSAEATTPSPGPCSPQPCLSCSWLWFLSSPWLTIVLWHWFHPGTSKLSSRIFRRGLRTLTTSTEVGLHLTRTNRQVSMRWEK